MTPPRIFLMGTPYPTPQQGSTTMEMAKVLATMNEALRMELTSALKYLDFSFRVFGPTRKPIVEPFLEEAKESLDHATMLGEKVVALGGKPVVAADMPKIPEHVSASSLAI